MMSRQELGGFKREAGHLKMETSDKVMEHIIRERIKGAENTHSENFLFQIGPATPPIKKGEYTDPMLLQEVAFKVMEEYGFDPESEPLETTQFHDVVGTDTVISVYPSSTRQDIQFVRKRVDLNGELSAIDWSVSVKSSK